MVNKALHLSNLLKTPTTPLKDPIDDLINTITPLAAKKFENVSTVTMLQWHVSINQVLKACSQQDRKVKILFNLKSLLRPIFSYPRSIEEAFSLKDQGVEFFTYLEQMQPCNRYRTLDALWPRLSNIEKEYILKWLDKRLSENPIAFLTPLKTEPIQSFGVWILNKSKELPSIYDLFCKSFMKALLDPFDQPYTRILQLCFHLDQLQRNGTHEVYVRALMRVFEMVFPRRSNELLQELEILRTLKKKEEVLEFLQQVYILQRDLYDLEILRISKYELLKQLRANIFNWFDKTMMLHVPDDFTMDAVFTFLGLINHQKQVIPDYTHLSHWIESPESTLCTILSKTIILGHPIQGVYAEAFFVLFQMPSVIGMPSFLCEFIEEEVRSFFEKNLKITSTQKVTPDQLKEISYKAFSVADWSHFQAADYTKLLDDLKNQQSPEVASLRIFIHARMPFRTAAYILKKKLDQKEDVEPFLLGFSAFKRLQIIDWFYHKAPPLIEQDAFFMDVINDCVSDFSQPLIPFRSSRFLSLFLKVTMDLVEISKSHGIEEYTLTLTQLLNQLSCSQTKLPELSVFITNEVDKFIKFFLDLTSNKERIRLLFLGQLTKIGGKIEINPEMNDHLFWFDLPSELIYPLLQPQMEREETPVPTQEHDETPEATPVAT